VIVLAGLFVLSATVVSAHPKNQVVATIPVGLGPDAVVVNPTSKIIYVANTGSNTVSAIEAATNSVAVTIPVGIPPSAMAVTPDGGTLYVAYVFPRGGDVTVSVIYTPTNTVSKTIDVGSAFPIAGLNLAVSPDGTKLYVATAFFNPVGGFPVIDTSTNLVSGTIIINDGPGWFPLPGGVVFNSSGRFAYVLSVGNRNLGKERFFISQINTAREKQINSTGPLNINSRGWTSIHGQNLYITTDGNDIAVFNTQTDAVVTRVPIGGPVTSDAVTPDGKYLYVPYYPNLVATIDTKTFELVGSPIQVGQGPFGIAIAPDGLRAYVTNSTDGTVSVIDISPQ